MLRAAGAATESADDELSALRLIAELDLGTRTLRRDVCIRLIGCTQTSLTAMRR